jgi:hypothetical protein
VITVRRPSGLAVPFEPPELTISASIDRSCEIPEGGRLLEPKQPEYLSTTSRPYLLGWPGPIYQTGEWRPFGYIGEC